jgi:putative FmdB family regulatory protein
MPVYEYKCSTCDLKFDKLLPLSEYKSPQECPQCNQPCEKQISQIMFNLPGDDWASKNIRIANQRRETSSRLKTKQYESHSVPSLVPNVGGEQTASWTEAKKLASSQGKNTESYDPLIRKENKPSIIK